MGDGGKVVPLDDVAKATAEIVKAIPVYQDALQPAARELGELAATPLKLLNIALRPVKTIFSAFDLSFDKLDAALVRLLKDVPRENLVEPPPTVAGPVLLAYPFAESEPALRDMFERLLATAMNKNTTSDAHPSFVEIIRQLNPDEARLLGAMTRPPRKEFAAAELHLNNVNEQGYRAVDRLFDFGDLSLVASDRMPQYVHNLERLGIVEISFTKFFTDDELYASFETRRETIELRRAAATESGTTITVSRGAVSLTAFGVAFIAACVDPEAARQMRTGVISVPDPH